MKAVGQVQDHLVSGRIAGAPSGLLKSHQATPVQGTSESGHWQQLKEIANHAAHS
jgi:hypothetical protein